MKKIISLFLMSTLVLSCESAGKKTAIGSGIGAAAGAAVGAIIGHQSGNRDQGAIIGAALGGVAGGAYGYKLDKQAKELEKIAETKRTEDGIVTKLKGDLLFPTGSTELAGAGKNNVGQVADILKKYPENRIVVVGHTDSTGKSDKNQMLSEARAQAVRTLIVAQGVPAEAVTAVGAGQNDPVADNKTKDGRAKNRRVELQIKMPEPTTAG